MTGVSKLDFFLFISCIISLPIYSILLMTMYKFGHKPPLSSPFFKIAFNLGVLDIAHLVTDWGLGKFANFGWLGVHKLVMLYPSIFAKLNSVLFWYIGVAQTLGVASMAINRMCVIGYRIEWTGQVVKANLIATWVLPFILTTPQLFLRYNYHYVNETGGVISYWLDTTWQWRYFFICGVWCTLIAFVCATCYGIMCYKIHHQRHEMQRLSTTQLNKRNAELKLVWLGIVLFLMQGMCGAFCCIMAGSSSKETLRNMLASQNVILDIYSWINPYLLMAFSKAVRTHMMDFIFCRTPPLGSCTIDRTDAPSGLNSTVPLRKLTTHTYRSVCSLEQEE